MEISEAGVLLTASGLSGVSAKMLGGAMLQRRQGAVRLGLSCASLCPSPVAKVRAVGAAGPCRGHRPFLPALCCSDGKVCPLPMAGLIYVLPCEGGTWRLEPTLILSLPAL